MSVLNIARFDSRRQLAGSLTWFALATALGLIAWAWLARVDAFIHLQASEQTAGSVTATVVMPALAQLATVLLLLIALFSLRGYAEDRRLSTDILLTMAPVRPWRLAVGKWLSACLVPTALAALCSLMIASLAVGTTLDTGRIASSAIGLALLISASTAIVVAVATLVRQPVLVVLACVATLFGLWFVDLAPLQRDVTDSPLRYLSMSGHFRPFLAGVVKLSSVSYFVVVTVAALCIASLILSRRPAIRSGMVAVVILLAALALVVLSHQMDREADWTATNNNSLTAPVRSLLNSLDGPVEAKVYVSREPRLRRTLQNFLARFEHESDDWQTTFVDPAVDPELTRQLNIRADGELRLRHNGAEETLLNLSEQAVANALLRLARPSDVFVAYSYGSGERDLRGRADFDLGSFGQALAARGIEPSPIDLLLTSKIPENLDLLIVTQPRTQLLPGVGQSIRSFVQQGGNVLWLADPGTLNGLEPLLDELRVAALPGVVVDASASGRGEDPLAPIISRYSDHPVVGDFAMRTVFPRTRAWSLDASPWAAEPIVLSTRSSWNETGDLLGQLALDSTEEQQGPLFLAIALQRPKGQLEQRVVVFGDGDFLSNRFIGNGGNLDLGLRVVDWLLAEQRFVEVPARLEADLRLELTPRQSGVLGLVWLLLLPGFFALIGVWRSWVMRRA